MKSINYLKDYLLNTRFLTLCCIFFLLFATSAYPEQTGLQKISANLKPFITTWKTNNPGTSATNQITIPTNSDYTYNYSIYWEDVSNAATNGTATGIKGNHTITFPQAGTYRVEISGDFPSVFFFDEGDKSKILAVNQWGDMIWKSMNSAFAGCDNLTVPATDAPVLSSVTDMGGMFAFATKFNHPIDHWDVSKVTKMTGIFYGASSFNQPIGNWNVASATDMRSMFHNASSFNQTIGNWNVGNVTNMDAMFNQASSFNQPIGNWNVSKVTNMSQMFFLADKFNQPIGNWDVSEVTDMYRMFNAASSFSQSIGNWNVSNVINMREMFCEAASFNQPIDNWNVGNVTNMNAMFSEASSFNQPIGNWNVSGVTNMNFMFYKATSFNQSIGNWDVSMVTDMNHMFSEASSFNQPIANWNVSGVTNMDFMFYNATSFNQSIGNWDVSKVAYMDGMLSLTGISTVNYDLLLQGWSANPKGLSNNLTLGATGLKYCNSVGARKALIDTYSLNISGDAWDCTLDITSEALAASIKIYPNPVHDYLEINVGDIPMKDMSIIDINGRQMLQIGNTSQRINIASFESGIYFLKVRFGDKYIHYKIFKY